MASLPGGALHLFVPPTLEGIARSEIHAFYSENAAPTIRNSPPRPHGRAWLAILPLFLLLPWYVLTHQRNPHEWLSRGALTPVKDIPEEIRRSATALTLHADYGHLAANLFFGGFFLFLLARACGWGRALLLTFLGGVAGNLVAIQLRSGSWQSIGYSTAVFASVGALGGVMAWRSNNAGNRLLAPGAALALLSLLGTEGVRTDFLAHLCGLVCGVVLGFWDGWVSSRGQPAIRGVLAWAITFAALAGAWIWAWADLL